MFKILRNFQNFENVQNGINYLLPEKTPALCPQEGFSIFGGRRTAAAALTESQANSNEQALVQDSETLSYQLSENAFVTTQPEIVDHSIPD